MTDKKQCSKCKVFQSLNYYRDESKQCKICLEAEQRYREKHRDKLRQYAKEYYEKKKEEVNEKQDVKTVCSGCKCLIRTYAMKRHEQSMKHQQNLNGHYLTENSNSLNQFKQLSSSSKQRKPQKS